MSEAWEDLEAARQRRDDDQRLMREAQEADRLLRDASLWTIIGELEANAIFQAVNESDRATREQARCYAVGIHSFRTELQNRVDALKARAEVARRARAFE